MTSPAHRPIHSRQDVDPTAPRIVRRVLFEGSLLRIGHVAVKPASDAIGDTEWPGVNIVAMPMAGVFALHTSRHHHCQVTANHAAFMSAGSPYRLSFPGRVGDTCITLQLTRDALAAVRPEVMAGDGFDPRRFASSALLSTETVLARHLLWRCLHDRFVDPLQAEELGINLLGASLAAARHVPSPRGRHEKTTAGRLRQIERIKEMIAMDPAYKWTLGELAAHANMSSYHLAHVFRRHTGVSVYRYVLRERLALTLGAVLDTSGDLTHVALDAGFGSHSHFTARFRRHFGVTPHALRSQSGAQIVRHLRKIVIAPA